MTLRGEELEEIDTGFFWYAGTSTTKDRGAALQ